MIAPNTIPPKESSQMLFEASPKARKQLHTYEQIEEAIKQQKGGKFRLLLQRTIDGVKCRAYTRIAILDGIQYWNIEYVTYGLCDAFAYAAKMFDIIEKKIDKMEDKEQIVLWRY